MERGRTDMQLGLGTIGIGRQWGHVPGEVPPYADAIALLEFAFDLGVRYFDTAPSYGLSEARLGDFLKSLKAQVTVATKFGEHWDSARNAPFADHSCDALRRSLDQSLARLGRIDVLQLHKTTPDVLRSGDLAKAWDYAASLGINLIGASVSDPDSARLTVADQRYGVIQLPYNLTQPDFSDAIDAATACDMLVAVNRPFAMGSMLYASESVGKEQAFAFILEKKFRGVILTGTKNKAHLRENWLAFQSVLPRPPISDFSL